jgi:hypothetical protein
MRADNDQVFPALAQAFQPNRANGRRLAPSKSASRLRNERNVVASSKAGGTI